MIVPEKPLWEGNNRVYVTMHVVCILLALFSVISKGHVETKALVKSVYEPALPVKKVIVDLPIELKGINRKTLLIVC